MDQEMKGCKMHNMKEQRAINNGDAINKKKYADSVSKGRAINAKLAAKMLREKKDEQ